MIGAQRLSASKIGSRERRRRLAGPAGVLNACRRQRSVHDDQGGEDVGYREVLNACRRQRSVHLATVRGHATSTLVLNACRRQRSVHGFDAFAILAEHLVLNACRRQRSVHPGWGSTASRATACAQRLSASKIGSPATSPAAWTPRWVLNACRRQRSVH